MQGTLLIRTERAALLKTQEKCNRLHENYFTEKYGLTRTHSGCAGGGKGCRAAERWIWDVAYAIVRIWPRTVMTLPRG